MMRFNRLISWGFTVPFLVAFGLTLTFFHPFHVVARLIGPKVQKFFFDYMNLALVNCLRLSGVRYAIRWEGELPPAPIIVVSNHQSMFDIPLLGWVLRDWDLRFISKIELARKIPSVSYCLRNRQMALIDRSNPRQAIPEIKALGQRAVTAKHSVSIFPEGTRARDGKIKNFKATGIKALRETMPNAAVVPVAIDGFWEVVRYKLMPVPFGVKVTLTVLPPLNLEGLSDEAITAACESAIRAVIHQTNGSQSQSELAAP